ncbi:MAG: Deoxyguanosinetriphosphate triphosphohydrolase-like protein [Candidatus Tokpelaia hoelldobleri]|uniref:Deoxyguanosinetriphosphate triphosphohydrolase-like protein n=1 Tax=Candidatus Tokpelaia hoelldobleri TaxID=1902579 RepID=A0A1U9JUG4_9HYPH|nr:MAG: Deoxyguanosinetriphosphate triphosphohydrolase-like protein [Candidatus Tokpelaia hoelldoblerii]
MQLENIGYGYMPRAVYATDPGRSRGRLVPETESLTRTPFQRDRDRIIHSNAFRRLKHKTQVFVAHEGDHYRTRLTHTIEVAQIARALARALRLDEDLAEAVALVHDFGHTPFGHAGEDGLNRVMADYGGFDHNAQTLRIVTALEHRYARFSGLNLSWETLEGLAKHNGPLSGRHAPGKTVPEAVADYCRQFDLAIETFAGPEAQCAAIADDIAYNAHDIDDGLRAGLITLCQLEDVGLTAGLIARIRAAWPGLDTARCGYELVRHQITVMIEDVIREAQMRLAMLAPQSVADIYAADRALVSFSAPMSGQEKELKAFLYKNLYYHEKVQEHRQSGERIVEELFGAYMNDTAQMPEEWQKNVSALTPKAHARHVADFLSGMTDHYAIREYQRLFDCKADLF